MRRHHPVRIWFTPWRQRCVCGCAWYPCPDTVIIAPPPVAESLRVRRPDPRRNGATAFHSPRQGNERQLPTETGQWRSRPR
ncbi:hypothetical protein AB0G04_25905 [Actinoplanes sp. NPDC023801]|uniref:hypothetical protein n=1 Tax=Actinoplanes sp. NPDC023801 TaxID=3154595 RepID=UPI0033F05594